MPKKTTAPQNDPKIVALKEKLEKKWANDAMGIEEVSIPLEITDTGEMPIVSVDLDTSYEALMPDPVLATSHVALSGNYAQTFPARKYENLLPIVSTVVASVGVGATIFAFGVVLGAGI